MKRENIWTLDSKGELLITIMSSLAQEESRSISENCTWGQRKRFADGKVTVPFKRFLGYDRGPDGNLVLNKDEAVIIRRIYSMFLQGMTPHGIAARLTADGIKSPGGKDKWNAGAVRSILTNEKYKGDALLQKSYTVDFLTKKKKVNEGDSAVLCGGRKTTKPSSSRRCLSWFSRNWSVEKKQPWATQRCPPFLRQDTLRTMRRVVRFQGLAFQQQIPPGYLAV